MKTKTDGLQILKRTPVYQGRVFKLEQVQLLGPNGKKFQHDVICHGGAAVIVPVLKNKFFLMVEQFRTAINGPLLEFPAGTLEKGEPPLSCAKREIVEEAGYEAKRWKKLVSFYPAPGISTELMHIFLATDLHPKQGVPDSDEFLKLKIVPIKELERSIRLGKIKDGKTIVGFYYYKLLNV
jgi:ADP-ribose pyrophosphatase